MLDVLSSIVSSTAVTNSATSPKQDIAIRKLIKDRIISENKKELVLAMHKYKKIDYRKYESRPFKMSEYFNTLNISDSRMKLRYELSMIQTVRNNFRSVKTFKQVNYQCIDCENEGILNITDSQQHLISSACSANSDLRQGRDFSKDEDICSYFRALINRRKERYNC